MIYILTIITSFGSVEAPVLNEQVCHKYGALIVQSYQEDGIEAQYFCEPEHD